jgi:DNA processing protein
MSLPSSRTLCFDDSDYPSLLRHTARPPLELYCSGNAEAASGALVSVIGSRRMTSYGEEAVRILVPGLVAAGLTIVSGLAYGVDCFAHQVALECGGTCVAVLGSALDRVAPLANQGLLERLVMAGGCALSEYLPGTVARPHTFPARNRIVAGLSQVTLIIEAAERSGTLITARYALDAGREVCVVPADITRAGSDGIQRLLKQGARPVTNAQDILALYGPLPEGRIADRLSPALTGSAAAVYDLISHGARTSDFLLVQSGLSFSDLQSVLAVLELDGYITLKNAEWLTTS